MLAEVVELVIGVDTHTDTHTAAVVDASSGALLETLTVTTDPGGYAELLAAAERHGGLRAFALEGAGGYGAGLARHLAAVGEVVVELDRPKRPARRGGRRSDPLDAERAARDALARSRLAQSKTGPERGALAVLLTAPLGGRGRHRCSTSAPCPGHPAPEPVRARFRGHASTRAQIAVAAGLRPHASHGDLEVLTTRRVLRDLARRIRVLEAEAAAQEKTIRSVVTAWHPELLELPGVGPINAAVVFTRLITSRALPRRRRVRDARRRRPDPGQLRQDRALPAQPLRRPPAQPSVALDHPDPPTLPPTHPRLHPTAQNRRQDRPPDPPLPQALYRPPALPPARTRPRHLQHIGASASARRPISRRCASRPRRRHQRRRAGQTPLVPCARRAPDQILARAASATSAARAP